MRQKFENRYDIRDVRRVSANGNDVIDSLRIYYDVVFTDIDLGDSRLPEDLEKNWRRYEFVKLSRGGVYRDFCFRPVGAGVLRNA